MTEKDIKKLIDKYQSNLCSPSEMEMLEEFMNSYQRESDWEGKIHGNQTEVQNRIFDKVQKKTGTQKKLPIKTKPAWWYKAASSFAILFVLAFGIHSAIYISPSSKEEIKTVLKEIPRGQKSMVHLSDGSTIYINSASTVSYPEKFTGDTREITLEGEAFFKVTPNPNKPFIVHTGELETKVLGTSFNINTNSNHIKVTVATGTVRVQHMNPKIEYNELAILKPNQQLSFDKVDQSITVLDVESGYDLAWTEKRLVFNNEPLKSVTERLELWYDVEFSFSNQKIEHCKFTAIFENEPLVAVLDVLKDVADIQYKLTGKKIILSGNGCL